MPLNEKSFAWFDTETTGLDPVLNDIIEIAIVRVTPNGYEDIFHHKVRMERPENAHPRALEVNGYSEEAWADAREPADVWRELVQSGLLNHCIMAGHNCRFDVAFLIETFKRHGLECRFDYHIYDTVTLALEHLRPWVSSVSLTNLAAALDIPIVGAHTALGDVRMTMELARTLARASDADREEWAKVIPARLAAWRSLGKG